MNYMYCIHGLEPQFTVIKCKRLSESCTTLFIHMQATDNSMYMSIANNSTIHVHSATDATAVSYMYVLHCT